MSAAELSTPVALSIATSDNGGGAGLQADLKTFHAHGVHGLTVFCNLTAQNPDGVSAIEEMPSAFIEAQFERCFSYFEVGAAKTGMLFSERVIELVARELAEHPELPLVVDPVMVATSGAVLLQKEAIAVMAEKLLPRATLLTPNLDEAGVLLDSRPGNADEMRAAAKELAERFRTAVLLKGGHLGADGQIVDLLQLPNGTNHSWDHAWIADLNTHGSGCTLSAAIAARLARGDSLVAAVEGALNYLQEAFRRPLKLHGEQFIGH
jgi:hydroxymethylpyrimidine/phosphomethylpyrimidine kinase